MKIVNLTTMTRKPVMLVLNVEIKDSSSKRENLIMKQKTSMRFKIIRPRKKIGSC